MNEEEKKVIEYYKDKEFSFSVECDTEELLKMLGIVEREEDSFENHQIRFRTLLNLIAKLQKENEELKNKIMDKELEIIGKEEYTKASMGEIIKQYYTANEDCITKQKVKDKIERLKKKRMKKYDNYMGYKIESREQQDIDKKINVLQELIEEREENNGKNI